MYDIVWQVPFLNHSSDLLEENQAFVIRMGASYFTPGDLHTDTDGAKCETSAIVRMNGR